MKHCRHAALLLAIFTTAASAETQTRCPRKIMTDEGTVHTLSDAKVFHGPVEKNAEIAPVHGNFDIASTAAKAGGEPFNLVCIYGGTSQTQTLAIPQAATSCDIADAGSGTVAACH